jgi:hypothetical protein
VSDSLPRNRLTKLAPNLPATVLFGQYRMVTFFRFPKDHWIHLHTTSPVESPFSAVRLRVDVAKRYRKIANAEALIWKILMIAEKKFCRLDSGPGDVPSCARPHRGRRVRKQFVESSPREGVPAVSIIIRSSIATSRSAQEGLTVARKRRHMALQLG